VFTLQQVKSKTVVKITDSAGIESIMFKGVRHERIDPEAP